MTSAGANITSVIMLVSAAVRAPRIEEDDVFDISVLLFVLGILLRVLNYTPQHAGRDPSTSSVR